MICYASSLHIQTALEKYEESFNGREALRDCEAEFCKNKFALQPVQKSKLKNAYIHFHTTLKATFVLKKQLFFFF